MTRKLIEFLTLTVSAVILINSLMFSLKLMQLEQNLLFITYLHEFTSQNKLKKRLARLKKIRRRTVGTNPEGQTSGGKI